jgi:hypothetical protein
VSRSFFSPQLGSSQHQLLYAKDDFLVNEVAKLDQEYFGTAGYNFDNLKELTAQYSQGVFTLIDKYTGKLILTISLWPIQPSLYRSMVYEGFSELDIEARQVLSEGSGQYWLISALLETPENYKTNPANINLFLLSVFEVWSRQFRTINDRAISLVASGFSSQGTSLLERFDFTQSESSSNVYHLEGTVQKIQMLLEQKARSTAGASRTGRR